MASAIAVLNDRSIEPSVEEVRSGALRKTEMVFANSLQGMLVYLGYLSNTPFRSMVHLGERLFHRVWSIWPANIVELIERKNVLWQEKAAILSLYWMFNGVFQPFGGAPTNLIARLILGPVFSAVPGVIFYGLAYLGRGRFEKIEPNLREASPIRSQIIVGSVNLCFQDPWSPLTGGVVTPEELVGKEGTRVTALADALAEQDLDIILAQEGESISAQNAFIRRLQDNGYLYFYRDLGTNNVFLNNSGLLVASKIPLRNPQFIPYPMEDREWIAKGSCQGALGVEVELNGKRVRLVDVHLNYSSGSVNQAARNRQLKKYVMPLAKQDNIPFVVMGDFNFDTTKVNPEHCALEGLTNVVAGKVTCSDAGKHALNGKKKEKDGKPCEDCEERIDAMVPGNGAALTDVEVIPLKAKSGKLLTDHRLIKAKLAIS